MVAPIGLRDDFDAPALRALAKVSRDPDQRGGPQSLDSLAAFVGWDSMVIFMPPAPLAPSPGHAPEMAEGFSHFVTSMTAPIAFGWSDGRVGLAPTGKAPPYHGAHPKRTFVGLGDLRGGVLIPKVLSNDS